MQSNHPEQERTEQTTSSPVEVAAPTLEREVGHIVAGFDFKPYLDAVITSSQRTRSVIYLIFIILIATLCPLRNTVLTDAMDQRLERMLQAAACWEVSQHPASPSCQRVEQYVQHLGLALGPIGGKSPVTSLPDSQRKAYDKQIELLLQKRTDQHTVQIPIVGLAVDVNDLWLLSGLPLMAVLIIFRACLLREGDNLLRAMAAADRDSDPNRDKELVAMAQVLSSYRQEPGDLWRRFIIPVLFLLPAFVHFLVMFNDAVMLPWDWELGTFLFGGFYYVFQLAAEVIVLIFICILSLGAYCYWRDNDRIFEQVFKNHQPMRIVQEAPARPGRNSRKHTPRLSKTNRLSAEEKARSDTGA